MSDGMSKVGVLVVALLALPILAGTCSTALFCRAVAPKPKPAAEAAAACPASSACGATVKLLEHAAKADSSGLRALLADPSWMDRLPAAATESPQERGQLYLRQLLGAPVATLEELRASPLDWRVAETRTDLDGRTARVRVEYRNLPSQAELGSATLVFQRVDGAWKLAPGATERKHEGPEVR